MSEQDRSTYLACMVEIKSRVGLLNDCLSNYWDEKPEALVGRVELAALQVRKILEIVVLAGISSHKKEYSLIKSRFDKDNDINKICKILQKINKDFLPKKMVFQGVINKENRNVPSYAFDEQRTLTVRQITTIHGSYGSILHANNPYSKIVDYLKWAEKCEADAKAIVEFLSIHSIKFDTNFNKFFIVQLHTPPDGRIVVMSHEGDFL